MKPRYKPGDIINWGNGLLSLSCVVFAINEHYECIDLFLDNFSITFYDITLTNKNTKLIK